MEIIYERCCGIDVHKKQITVCLMKGAKKEIKTFGTMTDDLLQMTNWLKENDVEMVAMESTASYWKPIYNILEIEGIPAILVNAQHIKNVPGRKTDVKDSQWIANLLKHGMLKASFIPTRDMRELRELVRYRKSLIEERAREFNRMDKVLQGANIKLTSVASSVDTKSGLAMIKAIAGGEVNAEVLSNMAKGTMKSKKSELERALKGLIQPHQQMILKSMISHVENLTTAIETLDAEVDKRLANESDIIEQLDEITGVGKRSAEIIISEIGTDMSRFPSAQNLASWAGMCPGNDQSAGKRKSGKTRKGNKILRTTLVQSGRAAANSKNTYLNSQYKRISARRGANRAVVAVGHSILIICYNMIKNKSRYNELGADFFNNQNHELILKRTVKRIESLGYSVTIEAKTA